MIGVIQMRKSWAETPSRSRHGGTDKPEWELDSRPRQSADVMPERLLSNQALREMLGCGRSKAYLVMHAVGVVYIGARAYIRLTDLMAKLDTEGEIPVKWPERRGHTSVKGWRQP